MNDGAYLAHHGILGQKWGVRRFETANGHLTEEGKKRYSFYTDPEYKRAKIKTAGKAFAVGLVVGVGAYAVLSNEKARETIGLGKDSIPFDKIKDEVIGSKSNTKSKSEPVDFSKLDVYPSAATQMVYQANKRYTAQQNAKNKGTKSSPVQNGSNKTNERAQKVAESLQNLSRDAIKAGTNATRNAASVAAKASRDVASVAAKASRNAASVAAKASRDAASKATKSAGKAIRTSIRNKATAGIDEDDPSTWTRAFTNAVDVVNTGRRYARAARAVKNKDAIGAVTEMAPDLTEATSRMIDQGRARVDEFRKRNGLKR